jgi:hypothetical protein
MRSQKFNTLLPVCRQGIVCDLFWNFKHASCSPEISTDPQGLVTDKNAPAEIPSKRTKEAMSIGTQGLRWVNHVKAGAASWSSSNRALDISRTCAQFSGLRRHIALDTTHLSYKEAAPQVAVRSAALNTQGHLHKIPVRLQFVNGINVQVNRLFAFGGEPRTYPTHNCRT